MSIFNKLFGKKKPSKALTSASGSSDVASDPDVMRVLDAYGRELYISREEWRTNVLSGAVKSNWDNADELYNIIVGALKDGFREDVVEAARYLYEIDPQRDRGVCIWGIVLMEEGRLDESEGVLRKFLEDHGPHALVLTNLAKVYSKRTDDSTAEGILWQALELDPNQEHALQGYCSIHRQKSGDPRSLEAFQRVAALPGSWRSQLWLARHSLENNDIEAAVQMYREVLNCTPQPMPSDLLMQISGDLGNADKIDTLLDLVEPHFDLLQHGLMVGNNLIKANLTLGRIDRAEQILNSLYAQGRIEWKQTLSFWDAEITKAKMANGSVATDSLSVGMYIFEGPIWLKRTSPAFDIFRLELLSSPAIAFLGSSAESNQSSDKIELQAPDAPGRMSRALTLFLAEQITFRGRLRAQTFIPWVTRKDAHGGFMLSGAQWSDNEAAGHASHAESKCDFIVTTHLKFINEGWNVELRLVRISDAVCIGELRLPLNLSQPQDTIPELTDQLLELLSTTAGVRLNTPSTHYQVPAGGWFPHYLLRLEQLLAVRCGKSEGGSSGFLHGKREILDGNLQLCVDNPDNVTTRLLLAHTLLAMKAIYPEILPEFKERIALLQREAPLPNHEQVVIQSIVDEALAT